MPIQPTQINLFTANQSGVETDLTGFLIDGTAGSGQGPVTGGGVTATRDTTVAKQGAASLKTVTNGGGTFQYVNAEIPATTFTAGQTYTVSFYVLGAAAGGTLRYFVDSSGGAVSTVNTLTLSTSWTRYSVTVTLPNPITQAWFAWRVDTGSPAQALTFWVDGLQFEHGAWASTWQVGGPLATLASAASSQDLGVYKQQMVLVYTAAGAFVDIWRDAPLLAGFKEGINQCPTPLRVQLPRTFDSFDEAGTTGARGSIAQGNIVQYWLFGPGLPAGGLLRYQGVIDSYQPQIAENGEESLTVTITPFGSVLGDGGLTTSQAFGTPGVTGSYVDPCVMFRWFFANNDPTTGKAYAAPLTLDTPSQSVTSGVTTQYTFENQGIGSALQTCVQLLAADSPNWFFRVNPDKSVTLAKAPLTAQHQFLLGQHLTAPQYRKDWTQLRNVIQVIGTTTLRVTLNAQLNNGTVYTTLTVSSLPIQLVSGQFLVLNDGGSTSQTVQVNATAAAGATSVTVVSFTANATYSTGTPVGIAINAVKSGTDLTTFGKRLYQLADTRVTDQATANLLATALLAQKDQMILRPQFRLIDYRGDAQTGLGYDIESLHVGDTCQIINPGGDTNVTLWDQAVWDTSVWDYAPGAALNQVMQIVELSYGFDYADVVLGTFSPSQDRSVLQLQQQLLQSLMV